MQLQSKNKLNQIPFDWHEESGCVFYVKDEIVIFTDEMKDFLISRAAKHPKREARLCTHLSPSSTLHEMIIVHSRGNYVPPHKHFNKAESFHLIDGHLAIVIFFENGKIKQVIHLSDKENIYYRLQDSIYHTVVPLSEYVVYHEVTDGPFLVDEKYEATWAPKKNDLKQVKVYQKQLMEKI